MRSLLLVFLVGCGGKLAPTEATPGDPEAPPPVAPVAPMASETAVPKPQCAPARLQNTDFGTLDVSKLGCTCKTEADCPSGEWCVTFPTVDAPRCSAVKDPCDLLTCESGAACIVGTSNGKSGPSCVR